MRGRLFIPEEVKRSIRVHLQEAVPRAVEGYVSAHEDEDTLTGHLGANLRTGWHRVVIQDPESQNFREWRWELTYYKFRGRGPGATEKVLGADGLFALDLTIGSRTEQKTLLFQAKTADDAGGRPLLEQSIKLSTWREAAFVLVYSESDFRAVPLDDVVISRGRVNSQVGVPLAEYLGGDFLDCRVGDDELRYDARRHLLVWRALDGEIVATQFSVKHRFRIEVESVPGAVAAGADRLVDAGEVHNFRMYATPEEVLGVETGRQGRGMVESRRKLALTYHPDVASGLDSLVQQILTKRMQEINVAFDRLRPKTKGT